MRWGLDTAVTWGDVIFIVLMAGAGYFAGQAYREWRKRPRS